MAYSMWNNLHRLSQYLLMGAAEVVQLVALSFTAAGLPLSVKTKLDRNELMR